MQDKLPWGIYAQKGSLPPRKCSTYFQNHFFLIALDFPFALPDFFRNFRIKIEYSIV